MAKRKKNSDTPEELKGTWEDDMAEVGEETKAIIIKGDEPADFDLTRPMSTGLLGLDVILGGGLYKGRFYEVYGEESHGKSTLTYSMMASFQRQGGYVLLMESESTIDRDRASGIGVSFDTEYMYIMKARTFETAVNAISKSVGKFSQRFPDRPLLVVWDTIAQISTEAEIENIEKGVFRGSGISEKPRAFSAWLRGMEVLVAGRHVTFVFVNQVREVMNIKKPAQYTTYEETIDSTGGRALRHVWSARMFLKKGSGILSGSLLLGNTITITLKKCKQAPEKNSVDVDHFFNTGFESFSSLVTLAERWQVFNKRGGGWIDIPGLEKSFQGMNQLLSAMRRQGWNSPLAYYLLRMTYKKFAEIYTTQANRVENYILPNLPDPTPEEALAGIE